MSGWRPVRENLMRENLVIGGGLAGTMAALRLAAAGRDVVLLEKERGAHHKVCGEFLSPEAVDYLRQAGLDPLRLGAAEVERLRLSAKHRVVETRLPFRALSLSRCILDAALLARAEDAGCEVRRGAHVRALAREGQGWMAQLSNGDAQSARNVFLATGKHDLHGRNRPQGRQGDLVGFKMHWRLTPGQTAELRGLMDLFLFEGGYGGLALVEEHTANLCLVVRRSRLNELNGWGDLLGSLCEENAIIGERLSGAQALWERPLAISSIPYGYLCAREDGVWPIGDQAAVIPSFTGDGMAIALHSGALAAEMYLKGESPERYQQTLCGQLRRGMSLATFFSRAMVSRGGQKAAPFALAVLPKIIDWIARSTRIPEVALMGPNSVQGKAW